MRWQPFARHGMKTVDLACSMHELALEYLNCIELAAPSAESANIVSDLNVWPTVVEWHF